MSRHRPSSRPVSLPLSIGAHLFNDSPLPNSTDKCLSQLNPGVWAQPKLSRSKPYLSTSYCQPNVGGFLRVLSPPFLKHIPAVCHHFRAFQMVGTSCNATRPTYLFTLTGMLPDHKTSSLYLYALLQASSLILPLKPVPVIPSRL